MNRADEFLEITRARGHFFPESEPDIFTLPAKGLITIYEGQGEVWRRRGLSGVLGFADFNRQDR